MFWKMLLILNFVITLWVVHVVGKHLHYRKYWISFRRDGVWLFVGIPGEWSDGQRVIRFPFVKEPNNSEHSVTIRGYADDYDC